MAVRLNAKRIRGGTAVGVEHERACKGGEGGSGRFSREDQGGGGRDERDGDGGGLN